MVSQPPRPTDLPSLEPLTSPTSLRITVKTWIIAVILLPLVGLLLGAITTPIVTAIFEVYKQASARPFGDFLELISGIVFSLINVLAVAGSAVAMGARIGIFCGSTTAITLLLVALINGQIRLPLRPITLIALTIAGATGAWYGAISNSSLTSGGSPLAYLIGGALFGLLAAQSILPTQE